MADWDWGAQFGDDDEEDNEEGYQKYQWGTRDGLIFLVDCSKEMFESTGEDDSPFEKCIKCAKSVIQNKIISSDKDLLGIVFFGTDKHNNSSDFKYIYVLHDLNQPGADQVLTLEALIEESDNDDFKNKYGHNNSYSISDALWTCSNMFSNCSTKLGYKRVMLFTNNDNPHKNNQQLKRQAAAKAEDLHQNGIDIELMSINKENHTFDDELFYKDILFADDDESTTRPDPADRFEELLSKVRAKDHKKRALGRIPFTLGKGMDFSVGVYNLVRSTYMPSRVRLYKKTNEEIKTVSKTFLEDTGEVLMPQDMKKCQTYATKKICFENEEITEIKRFDTPGIKLMGFKPRSCLKRHYHVKPAQFLYPDESTIEGSTSVFSALLRKCLERDVVAICNYIPRRNTAPRFAALLPQAEELDEHNVQQTPAGFHVIFLPFADDFRKIQFDEATPRANTDQVDKAKDIVKNIKFSYTPERFDNPALQKHYVNIEAMALDKDAPEEIDDLTVPNNSGIQKKAGKAIEEFKDLVFPEGYVPGAKRKAPASSAAAKKPKIEIEVDIETEAKNGRLSKLTVAVLKEFVKKHNIKSDSLKKADLIDAVSAHFGV